VPNRRGIGIENLSQSELITAHASKQADPELSAPLFATASLSPYQFISVACHKEILLANRLIVAYV
jgi:hypothetical protein